MRKVVYNGCYGGFSLSNAARDWLAGRGHETAKAEQRGEYALRGIDRHDPLLVECVEALGDAANGPCAKLRIAEIHGDLYRVDEYDGNEQIIEPNDQEWIDASMGED